MKINKYIKVFLLAIILLAITSVFVSAAETTINSPTTGNLACGTQTINVNVNATWTANLMNLTFYVGSSLTANTSWTEVGSNNSLNMTTLVNNSVTTIDFVNSLVEDANDYVLNVTAINESGARLMLGNATVSSLIVDCTIPDAPTSLVPTSVPTNNMAFSSNVNGAETTSCTLFFSGINPGASNYAMTHSGSNCSYAFSAIPEQSYQWYVRASDETNTTDSATQTTKIDVKTSAGKAALLVAEGKAKSEGGALLSVIGENGIFKGNNWIWIILVITGVIVIIVIAKRRK